MDELVEPLASREAASRDKTAQTNEKSDVELRGVDPGGDPASATGLLSEEEIESLQSGLTLSNVIRIKLHAAHSKNELSYKKAQKRVILPSSRPKFWWDAMNFSLLLFCVFEIPYILAFTTDACSETPLSKFDLFVDIVFLIDFALTFFTAYVEADTGALVVFPGDISINYARTWAVPDFLSSFPFDRCVCAGTLPSNPTNVSRFPAKSSSPLYPFNS